MKHLPLKIIFSGPESTAKTSMALKLSAEFGLPYIGEYAREYLPTLNRPYTIEDLIHICQFQMELTHQVVNESLSKFILCDTDVLTLYIWAIEVFGQCPASIKNHLTADQNAVYFLMKPDIPWHYDVLRENEHDRDRLFEMYKNTLEKFDKSYVVINGDGDIRYTNTRQVFLNIQRSVLMASHHD